jgi:hypothetical protein
VKLTSIDKARQTELNAIGFSCGTSLGANRSMEYHTKPFFSRFLESESLINFIDHEVRETIGYSASRCIE